MTWKSTRPGALILADLGLGLPLCPGRSLAAEEPPARSPAVTEVSGTLLTVRPVISFERATLRVAGPNGFEAIAWSEGEALNLDLRTAGSFEADDGLQVEAGDLPVGRYGYEVVFYQEDGSRKIDHGTFWIGADATASSDTPPAEAPTPGDEGGLTNVSGAFTWVDDSVRVTDTANDGTTELWLYDYATGGNLWAAQNNAGQFRLRRNTSQLFTFTDTARLGIGTTLPQADLHIYRPGGNIRIADSDPCPNPNSAWEIEEDFGRLMFEVVGNCPEDATGGKMWITGEGRVGIGTNAPQASLHLAAPSNNVLRLQAGSATRDLVALDDGGFQIQTGAGSRSIRIFPTAPDNALVLHPNGIGIGTAAPGENLEIRASFPAIRLNELVGGNKWDLVATGAAFAVFNPTTGHYPFEISPDTPHGTLVLNLGGRVGVGTEFPQAKLHVIGDALVEGDVAFGSSRTIKHEIEPLDPAEILRSIRDLPLYSWKYEEDPVQAAHVGPMAEDVHWIFEVGRDERHLSPADSAGLALAGVQGVDRRVAELEALVAALGLRNDALDAENRTLEERLAAIERRLAASGSADR